MNETANQAKSIPVRVFGLKEHELQSLREVAFKRFGKASVSLLAKKLLQAELEAAAEPDPVQLPPPKCKKRITLRLPDKDRAYLEVAADTRRGSINDVVRDIIQSHISHHPILSAFEADVLSQSNYQLVMIGRNLNQIARRLNAGENVSLSSQQIAELKKFIDAHVVRVNHVLQTNRRRKRE
ncbi:plasmid mobilization relaxosome protein MobC [Neisseria weaveri]|uniref:Bacterial mobilisation protein (MobC) n=1 Tax=Neisseria weaveri TaxID=28091 RepID=A0A448VKY7_9NEIS|nr:plasmid mobilization relaxosome protein MobC [Neisseria weaveri]VEJ50434.1 Bacterial mobilisation protein (MobC) [Neisseria weaveri]